MDGWMDGRRNGYIVKRMDRWMNGEMDKQLNGWRNGCMMNGWMD